MEEFFAPDKENRQRRWLNSRYLAKLRRKIYVVLLGFLIILTLPFLHDKNLAFNTFYNTLSDFFQRTDFGVFDFALVYYILGFTALYIVYLVVRMIRIKSSLDRFPPSGIKKMVNRFDLVEFVIFVVSVYMIANAFFFSFASIKGESMEPTLKDGDNVVLRHAFLDYDRYDLVVVSTKNHEEIDEFIIKRVIGLPGETLSIEDGLVFIDGVELDEPYLNDVETTCRNNDPCTFTLEENDYFLMGDNRKNSDDSRKTGSFQPVDFYGRVRVRLSPVESIGRVD